MKYLVGIILVLAPIHHYSASAQTIPSSQRSREAVQRIRPQLQTQFSARNLEWGSPIYIRMFKESKELELWVKGRDGVFALFRTYAICTYGDGTLGPKRAQGDCQAPEGFYSVPPNRLNPNSNFHLSFDIGYPNGYDRAHQWTGSAISVHGSCVSIGCFAMTDSSIEQIWTLAAAAFENHQPFFRVHAFPFRMTDENMQRHGESVNSDFWRNLREGYDAFKSRHVPPDVTVRNGRYTFQWSERNQRIQDPLLRI